MRTEAAFAKALYDALSEMTLAESGQKLRVYLDQERLVRIDVIAQLDHGCRPLRRVECGGRAWRLEEPT